MPTTIAESVRDRMLPMLQYVVEEYRGRVPEGYPVIVDEPQHGLIGIQLDPAWSLTIVADGTGLYADFYYRSSRWDARSSASREKFAGSPFDDRRQLTANPSDQALRNLIAELLSRFNSQQLILYITDT